MNYKDTILHDYKFVEKKPEWEDHESYREQKMIIGGYSLNDYVNEKDKIKRLENYGVPAGLVLQSSAVSPLTQLLIRGGAPSTREDDAIKMPEVMPFGTYDKLFDLVSIRSKNENNKTRKLSKTH